MINTLYYINGCPGARAVRLFCKHNNLQVEEVLIDFKKGEHMTKEFLSLNPMHTVPTVKFDDGSGMYESRLILKYLNGEENNNLEIDKWLFWDLGFLNTNVGKVIYPRLFMNSEPTEKDINRLVEKLVYLNKYLENNDFLVNNNFSIADLSSAMLVYNSQIRDDIIEVNLNNYPNIKKWLNNIKEQFSIDEWEDVMGPFFSWKNSL
tara:strand:- start:285 stop:902 length:618 start_codon:yes stop_codon:yes gene_type:complete